MQLRFCGFCVLQDENVIKLFLKGAKTYPALKNAVEAVRLVHPPANILARPQIGKP